VTSENRIREASQEEILQSKFQLMKSQKQKGYVRLITNFGDLLIELHCDIAPRTCTNFLGLCQAQTYDGTSFHRLISNFMIQGGQNKAGRKEDKSIWGASFQDEFDDRLKHTDKGVLSMANAGPNTNKQQFFITFKACPHLDRIHSIFGQVIDGMDTTLKKMQECATDKKERPVEAITIVTTEVVVDPAKEAQEMEERRMQERSEAKEVEAERKKAKAMGKTVSNKSKESSSSSKESTVIGKYLPKSAVQQQQSKEEEDKDAVDSIPTLPVARNPPPRTQMKFGDFSGW
jgi:peptidyl-prolyl cis-trans isomerase-like protein 2